MDETPGSITDRQSGYIADLVKKKDLNGNARYTPTDEQKQYLLSGDYSAMSKAQASKAITRLLDLNDKPVEPTLSRLPEGATDPDESATDDIDYTFGGQHRADIHAEEVAESSPVPGLQSSDAPAHLTVNPRVEQYARLEQLEKEVDAGYYFIVNPNLANGKRHDPNDGERFYHVSKPEPPSRWAGRTFIESRGGDFLYQVKDVESRIAILEEIKKDPITAMNEYGIRLGVCGCCGRTLTAKDSRLRGLGPICAAKILGAPTDEQLALLDRLGLRKNG